jgi:hypothetical protein
MQRLDTPGSAPITSTWTHTKLHWLAPDRTAAAALALGLALVGWRLWWNVAHPRDLFLDSWVLVHLLRVLDGSADLLPRGILTLHYPGSYLPFWPLSPLLGPTAVVKFVYPAVAALAALPAFLLVRGGTLPVAGMAAILLLPDFMVKTLNGTPQGIALPFFLFALHFALQGQRAPFLLAATGVLLTHHLTGFVTLVLYFALVLFPRCRAPGFFRAEWPSLLYFSLWPLYWTWALANTQEAYLAQAFLSLVTGLGLPLAVLLYALAPRIERAAGWLGERLAALPAVGVTGAGAAAAAAGWLLSGTLFSSPGLSAAPDANRVLIAIYALLLCFGLAAALVRRQAPLALFIATLLTLGLFNQLLGCARFFDGLRVADYAAAAGLVALFGPGPPLRWAGRPLLLGLAALVLVGAGLRLQSGYERLFAHTAEQTAAAQWLAEHAPRHASVATDAKLSLLVLGAGNRNATFEGTWWLFGSEPVAPYVATLNGHDRFRDRPIQYVILADYMFERGAEVTWFTPALRAPDSLPDQLGELGRLVWQRGGVSIWELDADAVAPSVAVGAKVDFRGAFALNRLAITLGSPCR